MSTARKGTMPFNPPVNPNDGQQYVWDFYNDLYHRAIPPAHGTLVWDFEECRSDIAQDTSAVALMQQYGLCLSDLEGRTPEEMTSAGDATIWYDTKGKVIGAMMHEVGVVVSIIEWRKVDWEETASHG